MNKKIILSVGTILITLISLIFVSTGSKRTDVYLKDYEIKNNGNTLSIKVGVSSSAGYIRKMKQTSGSMNYYLTFYSTFGINSKLGSKDTYDLQIDSNVDEIYFYIGNKGYTKVLEKDEVTGEWTKVTEK